MRFDPSTARPFSAPDAPNPVTAPRRFNPASARLVEPTSSFREAGAALARGFLSRAPEMVGQALQLTSRAPTGDETWGGFLHEVGQSLRNVGEMYGQSEALRAKPEGHGAVSNVISEGLEMIGPSVTPMTLMLIPGAQSLAGLTVASGLGAGVFGMAQAQDTYERGIAKGLRPDEAASAAWKTGTIEAGGEFLGTLALGKLFGVAGGIISKVAGKSPVAGVFEAYTNPQVLRRFGKALATAYGVEIGTEIGQAAGEAAVEQSAGISEMTPGEAAKAVIGPTAVMTTVLGGFGLGGHYRQAGQQTLIADTVADPKAPRQLRALAARQINASLKEVDPTFASHWSKYAAEEIAAGRAVALSETISTPDERAASRIISAPTVDAAIKTANAELETFLGAATTEDVAPSTAVPDTRINPATGELETVQPQPAPPGLRLINPETGQPTLASARDQEIADLMREPVGAAELSRRESEQAQAKERDLDRLQRESQLPAALYDARSRTVAVAAAPGPQPTAMQLAMERVRFKKPLQEMTDRELDLAGRLTRSEDKRQQLDAEVERRRQIAAAQQKIAPAVAVPIVARQEPVKQPKPAPVAPAEPTIEPTPTLLGRPVTDVSAGLLRAAAKSKNTQTKQVARDELDRRASVAMRKRTAAAQQRYAKDKRPKATDDVLAVVAKLGGWQREEAEAHGMDPAGFGARGWKLKRIFTTGGKTLDGLAEALYGAGFDVKSDEDISGGYDAYKAMDLIQRALAGEKIYSAEGQTLAAERAADEAAEEQEERAAEREIEAMDAAAGVEIQRPLDQEGKPDPLLADEEYDGLETPEDQHFADVIAWAETKGMSIDDIEDILERGAIQGRTNDEIKRQITERIGQRERLRATGTGESQGQKGPEAAVPPVLPAEEPILKPYTAEEIATKEARAADESIAAREQVDREAQAGLKLQVQAPETRTDTTGDLFGGPKPAGVQASTDLPAGWDEASPGGLATNRDPKRGGIVDKEIKSGKWFVVANDDRIGTLSGFDSRAQAFAALQGGIESAPPATDTLTAVTEKLSTAADKLSAAAEKMSAVAEGKAAPTSIDADGTATLADHDDMVTRSYEGDVTVEELRAAFKRLQNSRAAIEAELRGLNKTELLKRIGGLSARVSDKKDSLVRSAYRSLLQDFALGRPVSYMMYDKGGYDVAIEKMVEATTAEDISAFAAKVAEQRAGREKRIEGFKNPQTLDDFDLVIRVRGIDALTPEQLARYDDLRAAAGRERRATEAARAPAVEAATEQIGAKIIETKHTQKGHDLFVVQLEKRVDREDYNRLHNAARKLGGYYSSFAKGGAVPGFQFKTRAAAEAFQKIVTEGDTTAVKEAVVERKQERAGEKKNAAAQRLTEMADRLEESGNERLNQDRKTNTAKRAREASSAEADAAADIAFAKTLRNLAAAIESGQATHLDGIRTKVQVETLDKLAHQAQREAIRVENTDGSNRYYEENKGRPLQVTDMQHAEWPGFESRKDQLFDAVRALEGKRGGKLLAIRLRNLANSLRSEQEKVEVPRKLVEQFIEKAGERSAGPWWWAENLAQLKRLEAAGITELPALRAALREYAQFRTQQEAPDAVKEAERAMVGRKVGADFFPTPKAVAERMVEEAGIEPGMKVLEPSAGNGNIAEAIRAAGVGPDVMEISHGLRTVLEAKNFNLVGSDFMAAEPGPVYDRIVMNPPFSNNQDIEHVRHAYELLKPGGRIVAIVGEGAFFRGGKTEQAFRDWLEERGATEEQLPEGTFADKTLLATTGANGRLVVIDKKTVESGQGLRNASQVGALSGDPSPEEAQKVQNGVEGKSAREAALFVTKNAPNRDYRLIAYRVAALLRKLEAADMKFTFNVAHVGEEAPAEMAGKMRGMTWRAFGSNTTDVWVQGADVNGLVGVSYETVLHELLHAVTQSAVYVGQQPGDTALHKDIRDLLRLHAAVAQHFNRRIDAVGGDVNKLDNYIERIVAQGHNSLRDVGEMVSWGLTNREVQDYLESIPYQGGTLWSQFVSAIRKLLGLPAHAETALSELLRITDRLLDAPAQQLLSVEMPTQINYSGGLLNTGAAAELAKGQFAIEARDPPYLRRLKRRLQAEAAAAAGTTSPPSPPNATDPTGTESAEIFRHIHHRLDPIRYVLQDKFIDLKHLEDDLGVTEAEDAYLAESVWQGRAGERLQEFEEAKITPLLGQIAETGLDLDAVDQWLHARHAEEANSYLREINPNREDNDALSGMADDEAQAILAEHVDNAALQDVGKMVDRINAERVKLLVDEGLLTQDMADVWWTTYRHYVPLKREETNSLLPPRGQGFNIRGPESKRRLGSTRAVTDVVANVIAQYESSVIRAEKNRVGTALMRFAKAHPDTAWWTVDKPKKMGTIREGQVKFVNDPREYDNELKVKVEGKVHTITFNERNEVAMRIVRAMKNLDQASMGTLVRFLLGVNRFLAALNTSWSPEFVISNFGRDLQTAAYNLTDTQLKDAEIAVLKMVPGALKGLHANIRGGDKTGEWAGWADRFRKAGGRTGWIDHYKDIGDRSRKLDKELGRLRAGKGKHPFLRLKQFIEDVNSIVENGIRLAAFRKAVELGASELAAAGIAKNLTVNFNRRGMAGPTMNALYLFYNASVQGSVRMLQAMVHSEKGRHLAVATIGIAIALDILNRALAGDDDDGENAYDALPAHLKSRYWLLMTPGGKEPMFKFMLPWGYNTLHVIGQQFGNLMTGTRFDALNSAGRIGLAVLEAFNPIGHGTFLQMVAPTLADPAVQIAENKNWTGAPLKPEQLPSGPEVPKYQQHWSSSRKISQDIAEKLNEWSGGDEIRPGVVNVSPEWLDVIIDFTTGSVGRVVVDAFNLAHKAVTGDKISANTVPMLRRLYGYDNTRALQSRYYERIEDVQYAAKQAKELTGPERLKAMRQPERRLIPLMKSTESSLRVLRRRKRDRKERGESTEQVEEQIRQKMARFNRRYAEIMYGELRPLPQAVGQ